MCEAVEKVSGSEQQLSSAGFQGVGGVLGKVGLLLNEELKREAKDFEGCISSTSSAQEVLWGESP